MDAFVMQSIGETGIVDKPRPSVGPTDALFRPTKALVCTSDVHTVDGAIGNREDMTLGHEAVGIVEEVGEAVTDFAPGDRVAVGAVTPDWGSLAAQDGHPSQSNGALGGWKFANVKDGVFAEFVHVNDADANLAHIPETVSDEAAVYVTDMMSTGFSAADRAEIPIGGTVAVFAQGPVGLMATKGAAL
jgi:threonine dehydrogenase-like Zn-dependent dehydrogenase